MKINITCDHCNSTHLVSRTNEIPNNVVALACNWCPNCEDEIDCDYEERYVLVEEEKQIDDKNQTKLL